MFRFKIVFVFVFVLFGCYSHRATSSWQNLRSWALLSPEEADICYYAKVSAFSYDSWKAHGIETCSEIREWKKAGFPRSTSYLYRVAGKWKKPYKEIAHLIGLGKENGLKLKTVVNISKILSDGGYSPSYFGKPARIGKDFYPLILEEDHAELFVTLKRLGMDNYSVYSWHHFLDKYPGEPAKLAAYSEKWRTEGFSSLEAYFFILHGFSIEKAKGIRPIRFSDAEVGFYIKNDISFDDAMKIKREYKKAGFSDAATDFYMKSDISFDDAMKIKREGFSLAEIELFLENEIGLERAFKYKKAGFEIEGASKQWIDFLKKHKDSDAVTWIQAPLDEYRKLFGASLGFGAGSMRYLAKLCGNWKKPGKEGKPENIYYRDVYRVSGKCYLVRGKVFQRLDEKTVLVTIYSDSVVDSSPRTKIAKIELSHLPMPDDFFSGLIFGSDPYKYSSLTSRKIVYSGTLLSYSDDVDLRRWDYYRFR